MIVAILISVFIGQEYQWNTWQHKWLISKSRTEMYLSKSILSAIVSAITFFIFENLALLFSGQIRTLLVNGYFTTLLCGSAIYMALGAVLCFISMMIKNSTISVIASLGYILFSETFITTLQNLGSISITVTKIVAWWVKHSIYGMSSILATASMTLALICFIIINSFMIFTIVTVVGMWVFHKYEL